MKSTTFKAIKITFFYVGFIVTEVISYKWMNSSKASPLKETITGCTAVRACITFTTIPTIKTAFNIIGFIITITITNYDPGYVENIFSRSLKKALLSGAN